MKESLIKTIFLISTDLL